MGFQKGVLATISDQKLAEKNLPNGDSFLDIALEWSKIILSHGWLMECFFNHKYVLKCGSTLVVSISSSKVGCRIN